MPREIAILHAPSPLGLEPPVEGRVPGVRFMPESLRKAGLHASIPATFVGEVTPPPYVPDRDAELNVRNPHGIAAYSLELARRIEPLLDTSDFLLVLGGDCSILIGASLALHRHGRYGLVYIDAHSDCQTPEIDHAERLHVDRRGREYTADPALIATIRAILAEETERRADAVGPGRAGIDRG